MKRANHPELALLALCACLAGCAANAADEAEDGGPSPAESSGAAEEDSGDDEGAVPTTSPGGSEEGSSEEGGSEEGGIEEGSTESSSEGGGHDTSGGVETGAESSGTEDTGTPPFGDGDSTDLPAVVVQFRVTSPGPVAIDGPLFNEDAIDTRGVRYTDAIAADGDATDHLRFTIVPGESDPYVRLTMVCADGLVRAEIRDEDDAVLGMALCGAGQQSILLHGAISTAPYHVVVSGADAQTEYELSLDAYCFGGCNYQPYTP